MPLGSPLLCRGFKGIAVALSLSCSLATCRSAAPVPTDAGEPSIGERLTLREFDHLAWSELTETPVPLPEAIAREIAADGRLRYRDKERFRDEVFAESRRLGFDADAIGTLSPRESVIHAIDVVTSRLEFALVDSKAFREKYSARLFPEVDLYFHEGEGDCDKYRDLVKAVFALFREMSPARLSNVHVVSQGFGGKDVPHAWNAVVLALPGERLEVAHVDPTWYDGGGDLAATEEHVSAATFRLSFLFRVGEYAAARAEIARVIRAADPWTREALYAKKAAIEIRLAESGQGDYADVLATFARSQVEGCDHPLSRHFDRLLASAVRAYAAEGRLAAARRTFERLSRDYPRSIFRATLANDRSLRTVLGVRGTSG
jgi:tetratricopeptide (TPR) repeat protein